MNLLIQKKMSRDELDSSTLVPKASLHAIAAENITSRDDNNKTKKNAPSLKWIKI